eukprot:CAMPEP_0178797032 /NCGR_PEP_ID=MMETSP0745-20121128/10992_1 /TAXON_ID=913974 /ORGANISM="Nitzschia punctata, Strain CCMP561" /LENGTH=122 /DNA_ID=CAMNT_0020455563 /DNA_START=205 /DNA_END=570 /DNA_ORIENTATION=+
MAKEKERISNEQKVMEMRFASEIEKRDATILELEGSVLDLRQMIVNKDKVIEEQEEQIERYRTSFRQLMKLGFVVTGNKIKKAGVPLKRLIKNSPSSDNDDDDNEGTMATLTLLKEESNPKA